MNNFQRVGAISNSHAGKAFEINAKQHFMNCGFTLNENVPYSIGFTKIKKNHLFDLGGLDNHGKNVMIECKSHTWTSGQNTPSAKLTVWNEAMLYFSLLPDDVRRIFFVLKDFSVKRNETLANYYIRLNSHLIPKGVEIIEFDITNQQATLLYISK